MKISSIQQNVYQVGQKMLTVYFLIKDLTDDIILIIKLYYIVFKQFQYILPNCLSRLGFFNSSSSDLIYIRILSRRTEAQLFWCFSKNELQKDPILSQITIINKYLKVE